MTFMNIQVGTTSQIKSIAVKTSNCWSCGMDFGSISLKICRNNTEKLLDLNKTGCVKWCESFSPHRTRIGKDTHSISSHARERRSYRKPDEKGGCHFPTDEEYGWRFNKVEICDERGISAPKQGCCLTESLDKPYHNDFKAGREDDYQAQSILQSCHLFDLGELSNVYLEGVMVAEHYGFGGVKLDWIKIRTYGPNHDAGPSIACDFSQYLDGINKYLGEKCFIEQI